MVALIDLCALDTVERQTISSRTSIILNSLLLSPLPLSLSAPSRLKYIQSTFHRLADEKSLFMCTRSATQAAISWEDKLPYMKR